MSTLLLQDLVAAEVEALPALRDRRPAPDHADDAALLPRERGEVGVLIVIVRGVVRAAEVFRVDLPREERQDLAHVRAAGVLGVGRDVEAVGVELAGVFRRGEEKGCFMYGGSTIILLVEKDRVVIDDMILRASAKGEETPVVMGEKIGIKS